MKIFILYLRSISYSHRSKLALERDEFVNTHRHDQKPYKQTDTEVRKVADRQAKRQTGRQTYRHTCRQTGRQVDRQADGY